MKYLVSIAVLSMLFSGAEAANSRPAMYGQAMRPAARHTASVNQLNASATPGATSTSTATVSEAEDNREAERNACINNNIGIGNTFVWASRYSDTSGYASMVEDTANPKNNVCFVRVELKSDDPRISVADVPARYFMWGETIECGSWAKASEMEKRILDAKKGARVGGIVASTLGGAGLGVGVMEAFGNKLIGGQVEGQKALSDEELYIGRLKEMREKNPTEYKAIIDALETLKDAPDNDKATVALINEFIKKK